MKTLVRQTHPRLQFSPPIRVQDVKFNVLHVPEPEWVAKIVAVGGSAVQVY